MYKNINGRTHKMEPSKSMYLDMKDLEKAKLDYLLGSDARKRGDSKESKPDNCGMEWYWGWEDGA